MTGWPSRGRAARARARCCNSWAGLDRADEGKLAFEGDDLATISDGRLAEFRLRAFGFVFQQFNLIPTMTAAENVESALAPAGVKRPERRARVEELLSQVNLADRARHLPAQLSGGEQQRVAIARALANRPRVLLADEPTGNLDSATGTAIVEILQSLWRAGQTVVLVTHDARVASSGARRFSMQDGVLAEAPLAEWAGAPHRVRSA